MRTPGEYIGSAISGIFRSMSDCKMTLSCGGCSSPVVRVTSTKRGEDEVIGDTVSENIRVLAHASQFPGIAKGDDVELDGDFRIVTMVRRDPSKTLLYVGMSEKFDRHPAAYFGVRPGGVTVRGTVQCAVSNMGLGDEFDGVNGAAPGLRGLLVYIRRVDFAAFAPNVPQVGDELKFQSGNGYRITAVTESGENLFRAEARQC